MPRKLSIAIPASLVSDIPHLREKTSKVGLIGRAAAIFRVDEIIVYLDEPQVDQTVDRDLISTLLSYMETPQYLRRSLFRFRRELRFAGVLPPLRTSHHPLTRHAEGLRVGEYREGVAESRSSDGILVNVGVERPVLVPDSHIGVGRRVTVRIAKVGKQLEARLARREDIEAYWGYIVKPVDHAFGSLLRSGDFDLVVATSKRGAQFAVVAERIVEAWRSSYRILVGFGSPSRGLHEIVEEEGLRLEEVAGLVVNTVPNQGTETVRTEEAVIVSLAVLNSWLSSKA